MYYEQKPNLVEKNSFSTNDQGERPLDASCTSSQEAPLWLIISAKEHSIFMGVV